SITPLQRARSDELTTVDDEGLPGDPAGALAGEEGDGLADVLGFADPAERCRARDGRLVVLPERFGEAGADDAGGDGVHPYLRAEFEGEVLGEVDEGGLGDVVDPDVLGDRKSPDGR